MFCPVNRTPEDENVNNCTIDMPISEFSISNKNKTEEFKKDENVLLCKEKNNIRNSREEKQSHKPKKHVKSLSYGDYDDTSHDNDDQFSITTDTDGTSGDEYVPCSASSSYCVSNLPERTKCNRRKGNGNSSLSNVSFCYIGL